jgi:protein gp37
VSENSNIEWTDSTWNPVRGCSKVSAGCQNCYAMAVAARFSGKGLPYEGLAIITGSGPQWTNKVVCVEDRLLVPLQWRKPRRIFVNSMSDLFHKDIPDEFIWKVFAVMASAGRNGHTFQILTKRPERMREMLRDPKALHNIVCEAEGIASENGWCHMGEDDFTYPLPNVWIGVSVEDQKTADERIPHLLNTPAAVRFLSCEPLLGPVDLQLTKLEYDPVQHLGGNVMIPQRKDLLHWIIAGGESGLGARAIHPDWVRSLRDQCRAYGTTFHFKQWGSHEIVTGEPRRGDVWVTNHRTVGKNRSSDLDIYAVIYQRWEPGDVGAEPGRWSPWADALMRPISKKAAGRELDGRTWDEFPISEPAK